MKTPQQKKYEYLIMRILKSNAFVMDRRGLLEDFMEDCELFYDMFCDKIGIFFEEGTTGILLIDEQGRVHVNPKQKRAHHVYFDLLSDADYMEDAEDLIDYIDLALERLEAQVDTVQRAIYRA